MGAEAPSAIAESVRYVEDARALLEAAAKTPVTPAGICTSRLPMGSLCLVFAVLASFQQPAPADPARQRELEAAMGRALAAEFERNAVLVTDPEVTGYINALARAVAVHAALPLPVSVKVVRNPGVIAAPLPGSIVYVSLGAILRAKTEADLAALLAHQVGHMAEWRAEEAKRQSGSAVPPIGDSGLCWRLASATGPPAFRSRGEAVESEADRLAVEYLTAAGYDPAGLASMFSALGAPPAEVPAAAPGMVVSSSGFDRFRARAAALTLPRSPRKKPSLAR